jgi:D-amino-acid dehydrogenase
MDAAHSPKSVVIVGAGIVGTCCAHFLRREGHEVTVVDPLEPGDGTSFGNAGIIATSEIAPIAMPGLLRHVPKMLADPYGPVVLRWRYLPKAAPWLWQLVKATKRAEEIAAALAPLLAQAAAAHDALARQADAGNLYRKPGWLKVYDSERTFAETAEELALMRRHGIRFEVLDGVGIRQLEPALAPIFRRAIFLPDCGFVLNPKRLTERVARSFLEAGGRILREKAIAFDLAEGRLAVLTEEGRHPADAIVLAAGAWSRPLAASLGARVPLDTERGYHAMLEPPEPGLSRPVLWGDHHFILAPMEHGLRLTSGVEFAGVEAPPDYRLLDRLVGLAQRMLPSLRGEARSRWLGFRPSLPDSLPVLGRSESHQGIYFAFGHQHLGLTLSAVSGRVIADLVCGRDPGIDLSPYRAERW